MLQSDVREGGVLENKAIEIAEWVAPAMDGALELAAIALRGEGPSRPDRARCQDCVSYVQKGMHGDRACSHAERIVLIIDANAGVNM
jgi:hypothetical protein